MLRLARFLLLFSLIAYGIWPYYHVFRLDAALGEDDLDTASLDQVIDVQSIRDNYKRRLSAGLGGVLPVEPSADQPVIRGLAQGIDQVGGAAIDRYVDLAWVREALRQATRDVTQQSPPFLISAIRFAFFESYDSFLIRLGELGEDATHIRMRLEGTHWRVTDIIR